MSGIGRFTTRKKLDALYQRWKLRYPIKRTVREVGVCRATVRRYFRMFDQRDRTPAVRVGGRPPLTGGQTVAAHGNGGAASGRKFRRADGKK